MDCGRWFSKHLAEAVSKGADRSRWGPETFVRGAYATRWVISVCNMASCMCVRIHVRMYVCMHMYVSMHAHVRKYAWGCTHCNEGPWKAWYHFLTTLTVGVGRFDPKSSFDDISLDSVNTPEHQQLAVEAAQQSIVLLKNIATMATATATATASASTLLPYSKELPSIALVGPNADVTRTMLGNYHGHPPFIIRYCEIIHQRIYTN